MPAQERVHSVGHSPHRVRLAPYSKPSTTPGAVGEPQFFAVTHPFHPWHGRQFEVFSVRQNWGQWRVMFFDDDQRVRSLPRAWTSLAPADPFVSIAAGRARFRMDDLLRLVRLCVALDAPADRTAQR